MQVNTKQSPYYYNNNRMHFSICLFLGLWFIAQFVWTFPYQQTAGVWIADIIWFIGYASFGYLLYSLYYHFFRTEHEPLVLVLVAIIISTVLVLFIRYYCKHTTITIFQPVDFWIWDVIYNADHLCLAAALIGYGSFFSFRKQDRKLDSQI